MTHYMLPSDQDRADDEELDRVCNYVEELLEERDELVAHVERLRLALDNILHEVGTHTHDDLSDDERAALAALYEPPATSLARRYDQVKNATKADFINTLLLNNIEFVHPEAGPIVELLVTYEKTFRQKAKKPRSRRNERWV